MALSDLSWQNKNYSRTSTQEEFYSSIQDSKKDDLIKGPTRAMQPGLKFQDNRSLLQGEDVEVFFKNLEGPDSELVKTRVNEQATESEKSVKTDTTSDITSGSDTSSKAMYQNGLHTMQMSGSAPTYDTTGAGTGPLTSMPSGVSPVYVPTTRPVLPPMHYMTNGATQGVSTPNSAMWPPMNSDATYSTTNPHSSVSPRFPFAPSPSSPISTPTARVDSGSFAAPLARSSGINPYGTYMATPEISSWNFQMAIQQGLRQTGPGKFFFLHFGFFSRLFAPP